MGFTSQCQPNGCKTTHHARSGAYRAMVIGEFLRYAQSSPGAARNGRLSAALGSRRSFGERRRFDARCRSVGRCRESEPVAVRYGFGSARLLRFVWRWFLGPAGCSQVIAPAIKLARDGSVLAYEAARELDALVLASECTARGVRD